MAVRWGVRLVVEMVDEMVGKKVVEREKRMVVWREGRKGSGQVVGRD